MITVLLDDGGRPQMPTEALERAARAACESLGAEVAEISVALLGDEQIAHMNSEHLGHEGPTDVLAFALYEPGESILGDVYVGVEQAERQAMDAGVTLDEELVRLVIHGTLHVLGMDHPAGAEERAASEMYQLQEELVKRVMTGRPDGQRTRT